MGLSHQDSFLSSTNHGSSSSMYVLIFWIISVILILRTLLTCRYVSSTTIWKTWKTAIHKRGQTFPTTPSGKTWCTRNPGACYPQIWKQLSYEFQDFITLESKPVAKGVHPVWRSSGCDVLAVWQFSSFTCKACAFKYLALNHSWI